MFIFNDGYDGDDGDASKLAYLLYNIERGRKIFTENGEFDKPEEALTVIEIDGITYSISGTMGNIIFINYSDNEKKKLIKKLDKIMKELDVLVLNNWNIDILSDISNDFSLVKRIIKKPSDIQRRFLSDNCVDCFTWVPLNDPRKYNNYLLYSNELNREDYEIYTFMCNNTVILYKNNEFKYTQKITHIKGTPHIEDFTASKYLLNSIPIDYWYNMKHELISSFEEMTKNSLKYGNIDLREKEETERFTVSIPSFEEDYCNINPITISGSDFYKNILTLMTVDEATKKDENNQCQLCGLCLFGEFYAVELKTSKHICLCPSCTHSKLFNDIFIKTLKPEDEIPILLTVKHKVTYNDKINSLQVSDEIKRCISEIVNWKDFGSDIHNLDNDKYEFVETKELIYLLISDIKKYRKFVWLL